MRYFEGSNNFISYRVNRLRNKVDNDCQMFEELLYLEKFWLINKYCRR